MRRDRFGGTAAFVAALWLAVIPAAAGAQDLASLFAHITDAQGVPVANLRPDEVVVTEDGVQRVTVTVERVDWPVTLTILVDNTRVMVQPLGRIRTGLRDLVEALPPEVAVEIVTTAPQPRFLVRSTTDRTELSEGIDRIVPDSGAAAFIDGLLEASNRILDDDRRHFPVVLMVAANGPDPAQRGNVERKFVELQEQTLERPATYHIVVWEGLDSPNSVVGVVQTVVGRQMSELTGGRYEAIAASSAFSTLLPEIGAQIAASHRRQSAQYRVSYMRPPDAALPEGITVDVLRPGMRYALSVDGRLP